MARPLLIRVGDLLQEPGSRRDLECTVDLGALTISTAGTVPDTPVAVDAAVVAMAGGVEVVGSVGYHWHGECRRCLGDITDHTTVEFREIAQRDPLDDEILPIDDDHAGGRLDLEPLVRELVLSSLPLAPLCAEDCAGPDPERFPATPEDELETAEGADDTGEPPRDPRWDPLSELRFE